MSDPSNEAPQLPEVSDEAGDTPRWVPRLGLAIFVACILWLVLRHGHAGGAVLQGEADSQAAAPYVEASR